MNKPNEIIKIDKYTRKIEMPILLLMNRSFHVIGKISRYENWKISLVANGVDEISFDVHKYADGRLCPLWDSLVDLKIIDVRGFGRFEISVDYTDNTETVKFVHGFALETELAQVGLYGFHVNDEEAADMEITDYSKDNYDKDGNFIPTVFYNPDDKKHSLLHRVLADKAPHWGIGYVTPYIALDEESQPEKASEFQRTYTVDGDSIYDFLTGTVAEESNVVFVFDTINRQINCYSLCDCIDQETGEIIVDDDGNKVTGIGEDTTVFVSKTKLANEVTISSNKDNVKNCFRIEGGDDVITDMVRAVNMNGSNYINVFAKFQYGDMSEGLRQKIQEYQEMMGSQGEKDTYYGENGIYTRLCKAYDDLSYYESSMMPDTSKVTEIGTAKEQYEKLVAELTATDFYVAVSSLNNYRDNLFVGVTNNIEAYAQILIDPRFDLEVVDGTTSYKDSTKTWTGKIRVTQHTDETNIYPVDISSALPINVKVNDDELGFAKQKIEKALSKGSMLDIDFDVAGMDEAGMRGYFSQYSLNRLKSFYDGYNSCLSILMELGQVTTGLDTDSPVRVGIYDKYKKILGVVGDVYENRQKDVDAVKARIEELVKEQEAFIYGGAYGDKTYMPHDFKTYIGGALYLEFCRYRREDTYKNDNYISDGLSTTECLKKAKELIGVASKEAKKACVLQRTVSVSLNNLFAIPEFEPLYGKFALFNYIRVRTEDEILKLRIIGIDFSGDSPESIDVTFSDQIESVDGTMSDLQSIIQQAGNMATSYPSTALQAKKGAEAKETVSDIFANGLNAAKSMLTNNDDNEITITRSGILCRRMDDEGFYGNKQLRVTGNIMAFTDDAWESVRTAIGETIFEDPTTGKKKKGYGVVAENIVGNMIVGDNLFIGNKNKNVQITGDGIKITKGTVTWGDGENGVNAPEIGDIDGLSEFKNKVNFALTGSKNTEISSNYIILPKIGGGYMYIKDERTTGVNTGISVEINPNGTYFTGHNGNYVFNVSKGNDLIMGVDNNGGGYFSGEINAGSGYIGGWKITEDSIQSDFLILKSDDYDKSAVFFSDECKTIVSPYGIMGRFADDIAGDPTMDIRTVKRSSGKGIEISGGKNSNYMAFRQRNNGFHEYFIKIDFEGESTYIDSDLFVDGYIEASGVTEVSDERVKNSFKTLDEFDKAYMELQPVAFQYNNEKGKQHFGYGANQVKQAFINNGHSINDFSGLVKLNPSGGQALYKDIDSPMGLKYTEFIAWNTHMVQKLYKEIEEQQEKVKTLEHIVNELKDS